MERLLFMDNGDLLIAGFHAVRHKCFFFCHTFHLPKRDSKLKCFQFLCDFVVSHHTGIFCIMECTAQWALVESDVWWSTQSLGPSPSTVGTYLITCSRNHSHTCTKGFEIWKSLTNLLVTNKHTEVKIVLSPGFNNYLLFPPSLFLVDES